MNQSVQKCDIIRIDKKIKNKFSQENSDLEIYEADLINVNITLCSNLEYKDRIDMEEKKKELEQKLVDIKNQISLSYYLQESIVLIDEYVKILRKPVKITFMKKKKKAHSQPKQSIVEQYLKVARKYSDDAFFFKSEERTDIICVNCCSLKLEAIDDRLYNCLVCGAQTEYFQNSSSYNDIDRVNTSSTYKYDKKTHFKNTVYQYQGKQNSTIKEKVYDDVIRHCQMNHLLRGKKTDPTLKRFACVRKCHIHDFLKECGHTKHYEDVTMIHYKITGQQKPDISQYENDLFDDHDKLLKVYPLVKRDDRQNFINAHYVLFQLLLRRDIPCNQYDFNILKTEDRLEYHNEICKEMFEILEWNFTTIRR
jgi:hypothetical protein